MWNTKQTSEKSLSKRWQSRTKVTLNNHRWNVFRVEGEARLRLLKVGSPLRTLCSQCSVSVIVRAKTEHVSSVKLISSLTLQTLVTANILGSPGSDQMYADGQSARWGRMLQQRSIRNSFKTASLHVESIPVVSDCTNFAALPLG